MGFKVISQKPLVRLYRGQLYQLVGVEPYTRRDGSTTELSIWQTNCASCKRICQVKTSNVARQWAPNRRCAEHKQPGVKVRHERAQKNNGQAARR